MKRLACLLLLFLSLALPIYAQDEEVDDKTFLENWLEENLSAAGRQVTVTGFQGALSSRATMDRLTIADDEGVWLTMTGAVLDWTRSALLSGRLEVDALSAESIEITRRPVAVTDGPTATASDFALPELPVSIDIGDISADRVELGAPVLGVPAVLQLSGSGWLEDGEGEAQLSLERIDGAEGSFEITADYANATGVLGLDLQLSEGPDGIVATLTGLPGGPPLDLTLAGRGPVNDFTAELALATEGVTRLTGEVVLSPGDMAAEDEAPDGASPLAFRATLSGDPGTLFAEEYRAFFGPDSRLLVEGQRAPDGRLRIDTLDISTDALRLAGSALVAANGWPERAQLTGTVTPEAGDTVLLPIGGDETRVAGAELRFDYDSAEGDAWQGRLVLSGLDRPDLDIAAATLVGTGTLDPGESGAVPGLSGRVDLRLSGLAAPEGSPAAALGETLQGRLDFTRQEGAPLDLRDIAIDGADYRLTGDLTLDTDVQKLDLIADGAVELTADDLGRFSSLAGQDLTGAARLTISGNAALPGGPFDVQIAGSGRDLGIGMDEVDRLFAGDSTLALTAQRDETGTRIDRFTIDAPGASAEASGLLAPSGSRLDLRLDLPDASLVADGLTGPASVTANARDTGEVWAITADASAPGAARIHLEGKAEIGQQGLGVVAGEARASIADLAPYSALAGRPLTGEATVNAEGSWDAETAAFDLTGTAEGAGLTFGLGAADALTTGASRASFAVRRAGDGTLFIDQLDLTTPNLTLDLTGESAEGTPRLDIDASLRDLAVLVPGLPGAFSLSGEAVLAERGWDVTASATGPGGTSIAASGTVAADAARADLDLTGRAPLALANDFIAPQQLAGMAAFDLRLSGPLALTSLSGRITPEGARVSVPTLALAFDPVQGSVTLSGGQASLDLTAGVSTGGRLTVRGPVALSPPFSGELAVQLAAVRLTDPTLYDLTADGQVSITGPLTGGALIAGRVNLSNVELQIPETGFGVDAALEDLVHVAEPAAVRATRARAGRLGQGGNGGGATTPYGLDLTVSAPRAVFVRGRGLDAELGGQIELAGTTADVIASGGFNLIRGRLDLLGNRLTLTEGRVTMRGSLDPAIYLVAETQTEEVDIRIVLDGLASDPTVSFTSSPDLPEDEILARLVFGRGLDQISPFQALKLASAVATLSGRGGAGTIGRLREGFGLADLDVTTTEDGTLAARAGAYITDKVYTDVTVGADGQAEINLNFDINRSLTAKGSVSSDGNTGIGIYFEKDY